MGLLDELTRLQSEQGWLSDDVLREFSARGRVPLHRLEELVSFYPHLNRSPPPRVTVQVCRDVACTMAGGCECAQRLQDALGDRDDVDVQEVSCLGRCDAAPAAAVNGVPLAPISLGELERVAKVIEGWRGQSASDGPDAAVPGPSAGQARSPDVVPRLWKCNPYEDSTEHYGAVRSLVSSGADVRATCIERLKQSGLRGMGGAGFPTGLKWELVAGESAEPKYVICNADESEPGTFKDRVILEQLPHLVIEGMLLAGLTVGAEQGIVFLRHEYAREQQTLEKAIDGARRSGVLGENAAGSGRRFDVDVVLSPGGYILGEETALLESLEQRRGEPRHKPPYPATQGLKDKPTLLKNVETFALSVPIIHHGPEWWVAQGVDGFSGLKFVSVCGDVERPGVYEVPMGTTVRELIELAGGTKEGKPLAAFLPGGVSSNFLTAAAAETPLDFDAIEQAGSMLGTGAVIVMTEGRDLFSLATNIVRFFRNESCGKCVPCRVGTHTALELLEAVQDATAAPDELHVLPELAETLQRTSICGLGQVALNPIVSLMQRFPDVVAELSQGRQ